MSANDLGSSSVKTVNLKQGLQWHLLHRVWFVEMVQDPVSPRVVRGASRIGLGDLGFPGWEASRQVQVSRRFPGSRRRLGKPLKVTGPDTVPWSTGLRI